MITSRNRINFKKKSNRGLGLSIDVVYFLTFFLQTWKLLASDSNFFFIVAFVRIFFHIIETNTGFNAGQLSLLHCRYISLYKTTLLKFPSEL